MEEDMRRLKLNPEIELLIKRILKSSRSDPYSRQKLLKDFKEFYDPKPYGEKRTYPQNWPVYYKACRTEKLMLFRILKDAVDFLNIPPPKPTNGRPPVDIADILKSLCIKTYAGLSSWRSESELKIAQAMGVIENVYKRTALNKYLNKPELTKWLDKLYKTIAAPIAPIETHLAADASGISVAYGRKRWVEVRTEYQQHKDYKKLHIISGAKSNVIFSAEVTDGRAHDSPPFTKLLDNAVGYVSAKELSADPAYLSKKNVDYVAKNGMIPYILPKKNTRSLNRGSEGAWGRMIRLWKDYKDLFAMHYHQRSNVESTFGMLKRKFGYYTRSKLETGQKNEILTKIVCLNAAILSEAMLEFDLNPNFMLAKSI